jgi:acyl transferase domain-containing protein/NAD(P)H-dependent flavin oxidoreductase YrpB (nitropropane dioxygenase family)
VITNNLSRILVLAPSGIQGTRVAAACRASAFGIVDAGSERLGDVLDGCAQIARLTTRAFGIRISTGAVLGERAFAQIGGLEAFFVAVGSSAAGEFEEAVAVVAAAGRVVIAEVTSRAEMRRAIAAGVAGMMVVGNEAGGWTRSESSFVLMQGALAETSLPVWVRGGIGPTVAAGCVAAGAAGVVLDGAILLARESPLSPEWRERIDRWDGGETTVVASAGGGSVRFFAFPGSEALSKLRAAAAAGGSAWAEAVRDHVGWGARQCHPVGQDSAFAGRLARKYVTVGGIVQAVERAIDGGIEAARLARPLAEGSALAVAHGTRYPVLQGPMTRVSDVPGFADAVATGGGLPFLALALLRGTEVRKLLGEASRQLERRPWGVGILGFVPPELRTEQLAVVREFHPPFALFAGGRPDQAAELEREGILTYLHVPSPGLLDQYLRDGSRRFVLEGRECGGHVGPRSSFVLWEQAIAVTADALDRGVPAEDVCLVFAGGIHDARSAALVAALAGPLSLRGVKVGVLVGTGYLFTHEAVATGAIVARFQEEVVRCDETVLLESGPGHQVRVSRTPFVVRFEEEKKRLIAEKHSPDEIRDALEGLNVGRLRVATKGVDRLAGAGAGTSVASVSNEYQAAHGLFMLGQVAALRSETTTVAQLHHEICVDSTDLVACRQTELDPAKEREERPSDIAIVGMASVFPGAATVSRFWSNTLSGRDAITEIPADRWDWRLYYDADPKAPDKIVSKWGGFLPDVAFDPIRYGMPPSSLRSIEPAQLLALEVVRTALADAGYAERSFPRERTAVVLGMGGGAAQLAMGYAFRSYLPMLDTVLPEGGKQAIESCRGLLPEWTEDSFPGFLLNVTAGRIANRLNLGGANYTVDAACGSSLAAASLAVRELETGAADMVILGGVDTVQNPFTYLAFSKTQAFSPRGRCRPFDAGADGIVISEGVAALVLKRLADAERDGDRIYAVIKGVGSSSDGRARGLTAPVVDGQTRALERAYTKAGISPATVGYVEAHGTGTALGDVVEIEALGSLLRNANASPHECVVGSVKSLIGHTKCAAGLAGLINASLALYHKVLPPTIGVETPNPKLDLHDGPLRLCGSPEPWLHPHADRPRRAGVSAFGFGGTNFHAVLEGYDGSLVPQPESTMSDWPADLLVWQADEPLHLVEQLDRLAQALDAGSRPALRDLSHTLIQARARRARRTLENRQANLAIVATSHEDLRDKLRDARSAIATGQARVDDSRGIYFDAESSCIGQPVAFLFPGQGAQSPDMMRELAVIFPEVRGAFDEFDRALLKAGARTLGPLVFPPRAHGDPEQEAARRALMQTDVAQPAVGAACLAMLRLMQRLGCEPDMVGGHSFGELVALCAAGVMSAPALAELSSARGRFMRDAGHGRPGSMAAILAGPDEVKRLIADVPGVQAANWNGPRQTVIAGPTDSVKRALDLAATRGIQGRILPVSSAFHTPLVAAAGEPLARLASELLCHAPDRPVYSNLDAAPHPADPAAIARRLGDHLAGPVRFADMVEAMYQAGARVFVEVGPGSILTSMVESILKNRPHLSVACDSSGSSGLATWLRSVARLVVAGAPLELETLTRGRAAQILDLKNLPPGELASIPTSSTWLVNGSRARPFGESEQPRLGQALPEPRIVVASQKPASSNGVHPTNRINHVPATARSSSGSPSMEPSQQSAASGGMTPPPFSKRNGNPGSHSPMKTTMTPPSSTDRVIESFQQTMQAFLEVQKSTMLAYLAGRGAPETPQAPVTYEAPGARKKQDVGALRGTEVAAVPTSPSPGRIDVATSNGNHHGDHPVVSGNGTTHGPGMAESNGKAAIPPPTPHSTAAPDRSTIAMRLLETVRDRTGYPIESLGLDLDMEADLGIDSIKRVEILGKMRDEFPHLKSLSDSPEMMDAMSRARTLGVIVDRMTSIAVEPGVETKKPANVARPVTVATASGNGKHDRGVQRRLLKVVDAPLPRGRSDLMPHGRIVITDDSRGVAHHLESQLVASGVEVERIGGSNEPVDWTSPAAVEAVVERLRSRGPLAGIVHLLPLADGPGLDRIMPDWSARVGVDVRGLFLLAKAMAPDLENAARDGGACLIAATAMGGQLGDVSTSSADFFPGQGGVAGLVKTLAREWPSVRTRIIDFSPGERLERVADCLSDEMFINDGWAEVGFSKGRRVRLKTMESPLMHVASTLEINPGEPVLITGGARGITALAAAEMARLWRPTLLILGTTPVSGAGESSETAQLITEADIKSALHARLHRDGKPSSPADIEKTYQSLIRSREVRTNLEALRQAGATVAYAAADVRDPVAMANVLGGWQARHGQIVGLVHGAGLIKDKLIRHKSVESFDRVLETKLDGALNLIRLLGGNSLKFTALFSSIAGRFGNVGQSDYAAANDILNKLAYWLDRRSAGRVVSVIWGPWSGVGMVSQLETHLGNRGLGMISPEVGGSLLVNELRHGRKGDVEVIYSGELGTLEQPISAEPVPQRVEALS